jgi:16S rRNA (adenine1518-N6/adenine1519-N6)-dimethyltransferase
MKNKTKKIFAKKSLGQNFLTDQNYIEKIISFLDPQKNELIIEIGAGRGALTKHLVKKAGKVVAIEIDRDLIPILDEKFGKEENFLLIEQDALKIDFAGSILGQKRFSKAKLVANLPYYISTAILQHLIQYRFSFSEMVLMLQKEVVERITAGVGRKERGFFTVMVEAYFKAEKLFDVPPNAFRPVPKVNSSVVRLITTRGEDFSQKDEKLFRELVSYGFRQKRKNIKNNLKVFNKHFETNFKKQINLGNIFAELGIDPGKRAEDLELKEWKELSKYYARF